MSATVTCANCHITPDGHIEDSHCWWEDCEHLTCARRCPKCLRLHWREGNTFAWHDDGCAHEDCSECREETPCQTQ